MGFGDVVTSGSAPLAITGDTTAADAPGLFVGPATLGSAAQTADIILRARNGGAADSIALYSSGDGISIGSVRTSGTLVLAPGGLSTGGTAIAVANAVPINVSTAGAGGFEIDSTDLRAIDATTGSVVIGSTTHTGAIDVAALGLLPFNLTLQNEGLGAGGMNLRAGLSAAGRTVALATGGTLVSGGAIVADALQVRAGAGSAVALTNPGNTVNTLAVDPPASFSFVNSGPVRLGPVSARSFSTATGAAGTTTVTDSTSLGNFTVQTLAGSITLAQNITTANPLSNITLAAFTLFNNAGAGKLTPGLGGHWRVWADTWVGENRGGLAPTTPRPNFYGCAYGAACTSGVTMDGNRFIYVQQPTATVVASNQTRLYGADNPTPTFVDPPTGLVNGDTAADAFTGSLRHTAQPTSSVGAYVITTVAPLISAVGYKLVFTPGTLDVTPAPLTISADNQTRVYGAANQTPTRTVTGLVLSETEAVISGGVPSHTAVPRSNVGRYGITLSDAAAANYRITTVGGELTITPAPLTVEADNKLRLEGSINPPLTATFIGLVAGDTPALAEAAGFRLTTGADLLSPPGAYAITPGLLRLDNYTVTTVGGTLTVLGNGRFENPTRDVRLQSSDLYGRNQGLPAICSASDSSPLDSTTQGADILSIEWARVRQKPNLSNCIDLAQRNGCSDF